MYLDNIIKKYAILLTDQINKLYDPFKEFTRPLDQKYEETLKSKAEKFEQYFVEKFSLFNGRIWNYRIPIGEPIDTGDQVIWHGIYTAMWAIKYNVTKNKQDLDRLYLCMEGLKLHQTFHGEPVARLTRGIRSDGYWQDDVSNDQLTGHICGIYFAWKHGDNWIKDKACELINGIAQELINNNFALINKDGKSTTYGKLVNGILTDPLRLTLCLTILKMASIMQPINLEYKKQYYKLVDRYYDILEFPKVKLLSLDTDYDTHRAAIHLSILIDLENLPSSEPMDNLDEIYSKGLARIWKMTYKSANAWVAYLCARHLAGHDISNENIEQCKKMLKEFTLEDKSNAIEKINSVDLSVRKFKWRGKWMCPQPLPRWKVGSQDFFWQRSINAIDAYPGSKTPWTYYNGGDFMIAYWGFRQLNLINENE